MVRVGLQIPRVRARVSSTQRDSAPTAGPPNGSRRAQQRPRPSSDLVPSPRTSSRRAQAAKRRFDRQAQGQRGGGPTRIQAPRRHAMARCAPHPPSGASRAIRTNAGPLPTGTRYGQTVRRLADPATSRSATRAPRLGAPYASATGIESEPFTGSHILDDLGRQPAWRSSCSHTWWPSLSGYGETEPLFASFVAGRHAAAGIAIRSGAAIRRDRRSDGLNSWR